jgi:hypothetical protein
VAALLLVALHANATVTRLELRYLGSDEHVTVGGRQLSALLVRATVAACLLVAIGVPVALAATAAGSVPAVAVLLRTFLGTVATVGTQGAMAALVALALGSYLVVLLVDRVDRADPAGALRRGSILLGPVGLGAGAALLYGRYAAALAATPLGEAPPAVQAGAVVAVPLLAVGLWLGLLAVGLALAGELSIRGLTGAGSAALGLAAPFSTLVGGGPLLCLGGVAVAVLVWDLQETAIGLSEQLGAARPLLRNEVFRGGASLVVALLAVGVGYGVFRAVAADPGSQPSPLVVVAVLGGTALLGLVLARRLSVGGVDVGNRG